MNEKLHEIIKGPAVAVDTVVMTINNNKLEVLLVQIGSGPYENKWALPGGLVQIKETPEQAAVRSLINKTNVIPGHLEQLGTFGDLNRDVRGQIISIAYLLLIENSEQCEIKKADHYREIGWFSVDALPEMAFDHREIVNTAYLRLKNKMMYSNIAYSLLPHQFTLTQMQKVYEIVWSKQVDKRNFRKKILSSGIIVPTKEVQKGAYRPALLYEFSKDEIVYF